MKKIYLLFAACVSTVFCFCQAPTLQWAKAIVSNNFAIGISVAVDAVGNVYTTGNFSGTADFDPGPGVFNMAYTNGGVYITKFDGAGNFIWAKQLGVNSGPQVSSIAVDAAGNVCTTGYFYGVQDFDPGAAVFNLTNPDGFQQDCFISKLDANGDFVWAKQIGSAGANDNGRGVTMDGSGNVIITGWAFGNVDLDPGPGVVNIISPSDATFIVKLDAAGNFVWGKAFVATALGRYAQAYGVTVDGAGNVYTAGVFTGTVDFDPGPNDYSLTMHNFTDIFVSKLDVNGNFVWAKQMGGNTGGQANAIAVDAVGNVLTTGFYQYTVDFDPGAGVYDLTANSDHDIFILKLDKNGDFVWAKSMGATYFDQGTGIATDATGNVYTTGSFFATVDFDPGPGVSNLTSTEPTTNDIYISKLDASGNYVWAVQAGGIQYDFPYSITLDPSGNIYTTGQFMGTADFDPGLGVYNLINGLSNNEAAFVWKLGDVVLDVKLLSFNGKNEGVENVLNWTTASETNNDHFEIERSPNGISFNSIGAIKGVGNSSTQQHYSFADQQPKTGNNYYRLKQVDVDGKFSYSKTITINNNENKPFVTIYPNPTSGNSAIDLGRNYDHVTVIVSDIHGKKISESAHTQSQLIPIKIDAPAGVYFIKVMSNNAMITTQKIIRQ
ncbi:hypothetical protein BH11BAC3_BH11BAC3_12120 [soil metagenome]